MFIDSPSPIPTLNWDCAAYYDLHPQEPPQEPRTNKEPPKNNPFRSQSTTCACWTGLGNMTLACQKYDRYGL